MKIKLLESYRILNNLILAFKVSECSDYRMTEELDLVCKSIAICAKKISVVTNNKYGKCGLTAVIVQSKMNKQPEKCHV